jgi:hypothetical protein
MANYYQQNKITIDDFGDVWFEVRVSDNYDALILRSGSWAEIQGLLVKRITQSLSENRLRINSVIEFEYIDDGGKWFNTNVLTLLKNQGFLGIFIKTGSSWEPMYVGKIKADYEIDYFKYTITEAQATYKFTSEPLSTGLLGEVRVGDLLDTFSGSDWNSLSHFCAFGFGKWVGGVPDSVKVNRIYKNFWGHWDTKEVNLQGQILNIIPLNSFLSLFCQKFQTYVASQYGATISLQIQTKQLEGWWHPRFYLWQGVALGDYNIVEDDAVYDALKKQIQISSTDTDLNKTFWVDALMFSDAWHLDNFWTQDGNARLKQVQQWREENIRKKSVEEFLLAVGTNFGLITNITSADGVNFVVEYREPNSQQDASTIRREKKINVSVKKTEPQKITYTAYFSYSHEKEWSEFVLGVVRKTQDEAEPKPNGLFSESSEEKVETLPLLWGIFPTAGLLVKINNVNCFLFPNVYIKEGSRVDRDETFFNRMLWVKTSLPTGKPNTEPNPEWLPVKAWQVDQMTYYSDPIKYVLEFLRCYKLFLSQRVNERIGRTITEACKMELPSYLELEKSGNRDWKLNSVGNWLNWNNKTWLITGCEFSFDNYSVSLELES